MFKKDKYADPAADCPLWQAPCKQHACRWYIQVAGKMPQSEEIVNKFDCAMSWLPALIIENSQQQRQTGASTDKVANEVKKFHDGMAKQNAVTQRALMALEKYGSEE